MHLGAVQEARLEQRISPRLIQFYEMLQCPQLELEQLVVQELAANPALELIDSTTAGEAPGDTPSDAPAEDEAPTRDLPAGDEFYASGYPAGGGADADDDAFDDPMARLPAPVTLHDHLQWQFLAAARTDDEREVGLRLISEIDSDGYLKASLGELAMSAGAGIFDVERVLGMIQRLDPPGVGAADLRECIELQLRALAEQGRSHAVAQRITEGPWDLFCRHQYAACARKLNVAEAAVVDAAEFIRGHCHPYPGHQFRSPWSASPAPPAVRPEVAFRPDEGRPGWFRAEVFESRRLSLRVDRVYRRLYHEVRRGVVADTGEADHVQSCVRRARQFIKSLQQRHETLRLVAQTLADEQRLFLLNGSAHLQPLTRLEVARGLGLHESTVGRALAGKHAELPSGTVIPFDMFFDSAMPVRNALELLINEEDKRRPLSDQALTDRLAEQGFDVARRTVAKYRQELKLPPASQRRVR